MSLSVSNAMGMCAWVDVIMCVCITVCVLVFV